MTFAEKRYINLKDGQIHCRISGDLTVSEPLVCLHQTASSAEMFEALMHQLAPEVAVIAIDTPGYGQSFAPSQKPTISYYAEIVHQCLKALNIERCHVFGHHTGASIAVQLVNNVPDMVEKLILGGPPLLSDVQKQALRATLKPRSDDFQLSDIEHTWQRIMTRTQYKDSRLVLREVLTTLRADDYASTYEAVFEHDFRAQLSRIKCPTLIVCGEHDALRVSAEPTQAAIKHSELKIVEGAGTFICDEHAEMLGKIILNFL